MKKINYTLVAIILSIVPALAFETRDAKWPGANPVVDFYLNERGTEDVHDEEKYIIEAAKTWSDVETAAITINYKGKSVESRPGQDGKNMIIWTGHEAWSLGRNVVGAALNWSKNGKIVESDIVMNERYFKWTTTGEKGKIDVGGIMVHEFGHAIGIGHSEHKTAAMYEWVHDGGANKRKLHSDDRAAVTHLYPRTAVNNRAPVITSKPPTEAIVGMKFNYEVKAEDPDGDGVRFSLENKPLNMKIDSLSGILTWFPKFLDLGSHNITVVATDTKGKSTRQTFRLNVSNLIVKTEDIRVKHGQTVYWNVLVSPMDEYGIFAGNIELDYNGQQLVVLDIDTVGSNLKKASFAKNITKDKLKVAFARSESFSGEGIMFRIKLMVHADACGEFIKMPITKAFFNDGDPEATIQDGSIYMECGGPGLVIDGKVLYSANGSGVSGVRITHSVNKKVATTNNDGFYQLKGLKKTRTPFHITAKKDSGDLRGSVTAFDASLILRYLVGLHSLNDHLYQKNSADVNCNKLITAYDAALILRYIVGYNDGVHVAHWGVEPPKKEFKELLKSEHEVDFVAWVHGDVSGNWNDQDGAMPKRASSKPDVLMSKLADKKLQLEKSTVWGYKTTIAMNNFIAETYSGEFEVEYDPRVYEFHGVSPSAMLNNHIIESNVVGNRVFIAFAGTEPLMNAGNLFDVEFIKRKDAPYNFKGYDMDMEFARFNESNTGAVAIGDFKESGERVLGKTTLGSYPNPFASKTTISYGIETPGHVDIEVYNSRGELKATLFSGVKSEGRYFLSWDGADSRGQQLLPQVYFLRVTGPTGVQTRRIFKIQ